MDLLKDPNIWKIIFSSGVVAAVSSATISTISNRLYFSYKFKKEHESGFIQARAELYSRLFFWINVWDYKETALEKPWEEFKEINNFLSTNFHLVSPDVQQKWLLLQINRLEEDLQGATRTMRELLALIRDEFNNQIFPKYEKYVGKNIQKLAI